MLEKVIGAGKSLVIVAEDVDGEALSTLVVNKIRGTFNAVAVKAPGFGDRRKAMLEDMAVLTGAQVVAPEVGLKLDQVGLEVLGTARRITVTKDDTTFVDGGGDGSAIADRVRQIKAEIENTDSDWDREKLQERLAKLSGGVCVIRVGAATEVELKERKHRLEDAISATRAAVEEGIVSGGGSALVHAVRGPQRQPRPHRRRGHRRRDRPQVGRRAAALDRRERRQGRLCRGPEGPRPRLRQRLQRRDRRVRRPGRQRCRRPGQGHPLGGRQRGLHRGDGADHRRAGRRQAGRRRAGRRPVTRTADTATATRHQPLCSSSKARPAPCRAGLRLVRQDPKAPVRASTAVGGIPIPTVAKECREVLPRGAG